MMDQIKVYIVSYLHPIHIDASPDPVLLTNETQLGDAVQQPVIELQRDTECLLQSSNVSSVTTQ